MSGMYKCWFYICLISSDSVVPNDIPTFLLKNSLYFMQWKYNCKMLTMKHALVWAYKMRILKENFAGKSSLYLLYRDTYHNKRMHQITCTSYPHKRFRCSCGQIMDPLTCWIHLHLLLRSLYSLQWSCSCSTSTNTSN